MVAVKKEAAFSVCEEQIMSPRYIVVMGVSGTGKTTLAQGLADKLAWPFQEGDSLHPQENVAKMAAGHPLNDEDRAPWLKKCHEWLAQRVQDGKGAILTCSALKRKYRDILSEGLPVQFVYLSPEVAIVKERLEQRVGHYMPPSLLPSQYATLEEPEADEPIIRVPSELGVEELLSRTVEILKVTSQSI